jgi:hypothetical protein
MMKRLALAIILQIGLTTPLWAASQTVIGTWNPAAVAITGGSVTGLGAVSVVPTPSSLNQALTTSQSAAGAIGSVTTALNSMLITSDAVSSTDTTGNTKLYGLLVEQFCCTAAATNAVRFAQVSEMLVSGTASASSVLNEYTAHLSYAVASAVAPSGGGLLDAGNDNILVNSGATGWTEIEGREIDVTVQAAVTLKEGLKISQSAVDSQQGSSLDAGIVFANQSGAVGWKNAIFFRLDSSADPLNTNASIINAAGGTATITTGIDLTAFTITGNSLHLPGVTFTGSGQSFTLGTGSAVATEKVNGSTSGTGGGACTYWETGGSVQYAFGSTSCITGSAFNGNATLTTGGNTLTITSGNFNVNNAGVMTLINTPTFASSSTGSSTQTFTNSPCSGLTTEQWIPVTITGQTGTWNIPACK